MLRKFFNWAAGTPSSQYTLGGDHNSFKFNRAARLTERLTAVPFLVKGGFIALLGVPALLAGAPAGLAVMTAGVAVAAFGKVAGLINGGIAHLAAAGVSGLANHLAAPAPQHR